MSSASGRFGEFDARYVWSALAIALGGGLLIASYLGWQLGTQGNLPGNFPVWLQVHGHLQLVGWVNLFIMGVSLFFMPRLAGAPIPHRRWHAAVLPLTVGGLVSESVARLAGARWLVAAGGVAEWLGLIGYIGMLAPVALHRSRSKDTGLEKLRPFFLMMIAGWIGFAALNAGFAVVMASTGNMIAPPAWNRWTVELDLGLVLFPLAYAFSVRNLPYFLYLPPVVAPVRRWGWAYLGATAVTLAALSPPALGNAPKLALAAAAVGRAARDGIVLWLIWDLNVFVRTRPLPYILAEKSELNPNPPPRPWRAWLDPARWGRPEWLVRSAYGWLATGCALDLADAVGWPARVAPDFLRHVFLLGFITQLILGMAQKMVPGFLHKPRLALPWLGHWMFVFGNAAALGRVLPALLPRGNKLAALGFAWSGPLAWVAVALLACELWATARWRR